MSKEVWEVLLLSLLVIVAALVYGIVLRSRRPMTAEEIEQARARMRERAKSVPPKTYPPRKKN